MSEMTHTTTEAALIDLERAKEAMARRARELGPTVEAPALSDYDRAMLGTIQVRIGFDVPSPVGLRRTFEMVKGAADAILAISERHDLGAAVQLSMMQARWRAVAMALNESQGRGSKRHLKSKK